MKTSIVVFDIDGTLTDTVAPHQAAFLEALQSFGFPNLVTDWSKYQHHSDSAIFAEAWATAGWDAPAPMGVLENRYRAAYDRRSAVVDLREIPGAAHFLASLQDSPWVPVFATGSLRHGAVHKMTVANLPYDDELLVSATEHQTREEIVTQAIQAGRPQLSHDQPDRVVSVGDGLWDLLTAKTLDLEFVGIASGGKAATLSAKGAEVMPDFTRFSSPKAFFDHARKIQ
ncbi:HAD hydrolase-like protein [Rhodobacteraceae bacterium]|nr:HAD hydrolase-like protein [Paracoccaceae bacterium]